MNGGLNMTNNNYIDYGFSYPVYLSLDNHGITNKTLGITGEISDLHIYVRGENEEEIIEKSKEAIKTEIKNIKSKGHPIPSVNWLSLENKFVRKAKGIYKVIWVDINN